VKASVSSEKYTPRLRISRKPMTAPASVATATPASSGTTMPFTRWICTSPAA